MFPLPPTVTDVCHSWILALWKRCTFVNIGHLSVSKQLSVDVTLVKGINQCLFAVESNAVGHIEQLWLQDDSSPLASL